MTNPESSLTSRSVKSPDYAEHGRTIQAAMTPPCHPKKPLDKFK